MTIIDFHTHHHGRHEAIISCGLDDFDPQPGLCYSVGIHPWHSASAGPDEMERVAVLARHPQVVAIGETGLDTLRGAPLPRQLELLEKHIAIAEQVGKPLVVHCVRASQHLIDLWRRTAPHRVALAVHGMRANEHVAETLTRQGFYLGYGPRHNAAAVAVTPTDRILLETDDADSTIATTIEAVAATMAMDAAQLEATARRNTLAWMHSGANDTGRH